MGQDAFELEVDRNFDAFTALLGELLPSRRGEFALLHSGAIVSFHASEHEALACGREQFPDGIFSVQEVTDRVADLGFFSHAIDPRLA